MALRSVPVVNLGSVRCNSHHAPANTTSTEHVGTERRYEPFTQDGSGISLSYRLVGLMDQAFSGRLGNEL